MAKYRKKPVTVEAVQWFKEGDHPAVKTFLIFARSTGKSTLMPDGTTLHSGMAAPKKYMIETLEGNMEVHPGDWVVNGNHDDVWAIKDHIFKDNYERVEE